MRRCVRLVGGYVRRARGRPPEIRRTGPSQRSNPMGIGIGTLLIIIVIILLLT